MIRSEVIGFARSVTEPQQRRATASARLRLFHANLEAFIARQRRTNSLACSSMLQPRPSDITVLARSRYNTYLNCTYVLYFSLRVIANNLRLICAHGELFISRNSSTVYTRNYFEPPYLRPSPSPGRLPLSLYRV